MAENGRRVVHEIPRVPRAPVDLSEDELHKVMEGLLRVDGGEDLYEKFQRALTIESNPGGAFYRGGEAA